MKAMITGCTQAGHCHLPGLGAGTWGQDPYTWRGLGGGSRAFNLLGLCCSL